MAAAPPSGFHAGAAALLKAADEDVARGKSEAEAAQQRAFAAKAAATANAVVWSERERMQVDAMSFKKRNRRTYV